MNQMKFDLQVYTVRTVSVLLDYQTHCGLGVVVCVCACDSF